jgi:trimeric autotransporter adhesin
VLKKIMAIVLALVVLSGMPVYAGDTQVKVFVNNAEVVSDPPAILVNNSTFIPFRAILNALGVKDSEIVWNGDSSSIEIKTKDRYIFMAIGNTGVIVDKTMKTLSGAPFIYEGRTYIPLRAISEILGAKVEWNAEKMEAYLTKAD